MRLSTGFASRGFDLLAASRFEIRNAREANPCPCLFQLRGGRYASLIGGIRVVILRLTDG